MNEVITPERVNEISRQLQEPFAASDIEWRIQSAGLKANGEPWGRCLAYVTARAIMERLDNVVGCAGWRDEYAAGPGGGIICRLSLRIGSEWITKEDGAENTDIEAVKGGLSGAIKRAAVKWGIGRYLYNLEEGWAEFRQDGEHNAKIENKYFRWSPPGLPSWALPGGSGKPDGKSQAPAPKPATAQTTASREAPSAPAPKPAAPAAQAPKPAPKPAPEVPRDADAGKDMSWESFPCPKWFKKGAYFGQTLQVVPKEDLIWWADNYEPKPWKGRINPADEDFKAALLAAKAALLVPAIPDSEADERRAANQSDGADEDVPF